LTPKPDARAGADQRMVDGRDSQSLVVAPPERPSQGEDRPSTGMVCLIGEGIPCLLEIFP
jgi:hypothetical protein